MDGWMDRQKNRRIDGWIYRRRARWTDDLWLDLNERAVSVDEQKGAPDAAAARRQAAL